MSEPSRRILVVDDDAEIRFLHGQYLTGFGYEVEEAGDGIEALAKLPLEIDLVLVDGEMPHMDGFEVARRIREESGHQDLPVVMVTGLARKEDRIHAYEVGISDFISKPVDPHELRLRLRWLLELKATQDALKAYQARLEEKVEQRTLALRKALDEVTTARRLTYDAHLDTIRRLTVAAEYRDGDTAHHIERIGRFSQAMGRAMGRSPTEVELLLHAAPMHDVGKLGIPDSVLLKPGPLDPQERAIMNTHTTVGAQILAGSTSPVIRLGETIARAHHERWDGAGYPNGMAGDDIPLEARICAVVDFFDALTMDRPYRGAVPNDDVVEMMEEEAGKHFDPEVFGVFLDIRDEIEEIQAECQPDA